MRFSALAAALAAMAAQGPAYLAADEPDPQIAADNAAKDRANAEKDRANAEKDRISAEADLARMRITSLGLPSYQGTTQTDATAGKIEAVQLASRALVEAAATIACEITGRSEAQKPCDTKTAAAQVGGEARKTALAKPLLLLTAADPLDFGVVGAVRAEMQSIAAELSVALKLATGKPPAGRGPGGKPYVGGAGAVAGVSAIAGLLRSDADVKGIEVTEVNDAMLVTAVAAQLKENAIIPGAAIAPIAPAADQSDILGQLNALAALNQKALGERDALGELPPTDPTKRKIAALAAASARFQAFYTRVTTADSKGVVLIALAARLEYTSKYSGAVLRVHVDKGGGSLTKVNNITTFFGADPLKVTGGLVVSYTLTEPATGSVLAARIINCRTARATLRQIQEGRFVVYDDGAGGKRGSASSKRAVCS